jgi:DNA-binding NarL/FixJ family response regulator
MKSVSRQSKSDGDLQEPTKSGRVENREIEKRESDTNPEQEFHVLIVDRDSMSSHLLATALRRQRNIRASVVESVDLLRHLGVQRVDMVILGSNVNQVSPTEFGLARAVSRARPSVLIVILLNHSTRDSVLNAFRSGARGVFPRQQPIADFLDCVEHVRKGHIWAPEHETNLFLEAIRSMPSPSPSSPSDTAPLTYRERQVVQSAARGKTNKVIASELGLSEHTVKNYLFHAFQKLGVSSRVELLLYLTMRGHALGSGGPDDLDANRNDNAEC